ncbi:MAG: hypothetical protein WC482_00745 [Candidatus Omnitrophota bacterium]
MDEERKIDINKIPEKIPRIVLETILGTGNEDVAASIINWRSKARIPNGAWDDDYESLTHPYKCKHADFSVIEELMLVKGMTPELFESVKDYLTVYGQDGKININTATRKVMLACGLGVNMVNGIMNVRNGQDGIAGTKDDGLVNDITPEAVAKWNIAFDENEKNALNYFTTKSNYFRIESRGAVEGSKIGVKIACVVDRKAKKLIYYREY